MKNEETKVTRLNEEELKSVTGGTGSKLEEQEADSSILNRAMQELGKPYLWGGVGPDAYDCSGLVSYCVSGVHARIGTVQTFMGWQRVSNPEPGDICVNDNHCGIYAGGGQMIHAPCEGAIVSYGPIQRGMIYVRR